MLEQMIRLIIETILKSILTDISKLVFDKIKTTLTANKSDSDHD